MARESNHIGPEGYPTRQFFYPTLTLLIAVLALAILSAPAWAGVQRPVKPPLPNPMPRIVKMTDDDPMAASAAGYWDGEVIHMGDPSYKFGVRHELGHAYDEMYLDAAERQRFATLQAQTYDERGRVDGTDGSETLRWVTIAENPDGTVTASYGDPGELFADAYGACRSGYVVASGHTWETGYGYQPTAKQHRTICKAIARMASDPGTPLSPDGWR
jgi:hypothetical protein